MRTDSRQDKSSHPQSLRRRDFVAGAVTAAESMVDYAKETLDRAEALKREQPFRSARAIIAIGRKFGTLSEIAFAKVEGIPVIGLATWQLTRDGLEEDPILRARDAKEAVALALKAAQSRPG